MTNMQMPRFHNLEPIALKQIPETTYGEFAGVVVQLLSDRCNHCVHYFASPSKDAYRLFMIIAVDAESTLTAISTRPVKSGVDELDSLTPAIPALHVFERSIAEETGIVFLQHPWPRPVRFPVATADSRASMAEYPFFRIHSNEVHEVGVGPIHAGIIEPGHFRFFCHGEKILHLEIMLGFQHRAIENLIKENRNPLKGIIMAESIAGDTVVGHSTAYVRAWETLAGKEADKETELARAVALELERIAMHTADLSALCTDVAYQLGSAVFQGLRTVIINTFLVWCGNRFARNLIRFSHNPYPLTAAMATIIQKNLSLFRERYDEMAAKMLDMPSILARFDHTGVVSTEQAGEMGFVGMTARSSGLLRDVRTTHPCGMYLRENHRPVILQGGDVKARARLRDAEIKQSLEMIMRWLDDYLPGAGSKAIGQDFRKEESLIVSLSEGWRGEIAHIIITGRERIEDFRIKDPSLHNWMALALAVRGNDISDFPVCNKSFNLSYCGHDL